MSTAGTFWITASQFDAIVLFFGYIVYGRQGADGYCFRVIYLSNQEQLA